MISLHRSQRILSLHRSQMILSLHRNPEMLTAHRQMAPTPPISDTKRRTRNQFTLSRKCGSTLCRQGTPKAKTWDTSRDTATRDFDTSTQTIEQIKVEPSEAITLFTCARNTSRPL
jgi:hypothetical protein